MRLLAWRSAKAWTLWHIDHLGRPLCGARVPDRPVASAHKPATPNDWARICENCRELALRAATGPIEVPGGVVIDLMATRTESRKTKPADSGQAVDGRNGPAGAAGPVALEDTTAGQERALT